MKQERIDLMEDAPVSKAVWKLAVPTIIAMIVQVIYNMTDIFFIGKLGDPDLIAALNLAMPIFLFNLAIGNIFATGTASYISRKLGARNIKEAKRANAVGFYSSIILGLISTVLFLIFKELIFQSIGTSEMTYKPTLEYYIIIVLFSIPLIL